MIDTFNTPDTQASSTSPPPPDFDFSNVEDVVQRAAVELEWLEIELDGIDCDDLPADVDTAVEDLRCEVWMARGKIDRVLEKLRSAVEAAAAANDGGGKCSDISER